MSILKVSAVFIGLQLLASPVYAQGTTAKDNAHTYQGGPKTEVPHSMKAKKTTPTTTGQASGGHHYQGGPKTEVPHHMQDKK